MRRFLRACLPFLYIMVALLMPTTSSPAFSQPPAMSKTVQEAPQKKSLDWAGLAMVVVVGGLMIVLQHRSLARVQQR